jgi:hypothetical protein
MRWEVVGTEVERQVLIVYDIIGWHSGEHERSGAVA